MIKEEIILNIEKACFKDSWSLKAIKDSLDSKFYKFFIIDNYAFISYMLIDDRAELIRIAVLPEYRKKHIATRLMNMLIKDLNENHINKCFLEVRKSNKIAIDLYEKYNFKLINIRKNYYSNPLEDAFDMMLELERND